MKGDDSSKLSDEQFDLYLVHELDQEAAEQAVFTLFRQARIVSARG